MFKPIHKHLLIKATITNPFIKARDAKKFLVDLVNLVGMKPVTKPQAVYVADAGNEGFTGSINLATSHIAFHIWDKSGLLMLDLYSCKEFNEHKVIKFIDDVLKYEIKNEKVFGKSSGVIQCSYEVIDRIEI